MKEWLQHVEDGSLYDVNPILERHPKLRKVTDAEVFPEKYAPPAVVAKMAELKDAGEQIALFTEEIPEPPPLTNEELNTELTVRTRKRGK